MSAARHCARCGAALDDNCRFCPGCGTPLASPDSTGRAAADLHPNVAGLLCYLLLFVSGILFLLIEPYSRSRFVRFHAFQSIFFFIVIVVVQVLAVTLGLVMNAVFPPPLDLIPQVLVSAVTLALLFLWILLMYKAYRHEMFRLPLIGNLAAGQA